MALTQVYTAVPNDVITAARWNNEFGNIYDNGTLVAFPATIDISLDGKQLTLDASGATLVQSSAATALLFTPGAKTGTPGVGANRGQNVDILSSTFTDSNTAGSGTAAEFSSVSIGTPTLAATNTSVTTTDAATLYIQAAPIAGTNETITNPWAIWVDGGAVRFDGAATITGAITAASSAHVGSLLFGKAIGGLTYSRDAGDVSNDILVAVGEAVSDDTTLASRRLMVLASSIIGQVDTGTWVVGTNQPKLDTGTVANVPYYIWLIQRSDTAVVDILFSASGTAPTMPTNYAFKRLIGWFNRVGAVNLAFTTTEIAGGGIYFIYNAPVADVALANTLTTARRTDALSIPLAFSVFVHVRLLLDDAGLFLLLVGNPDEADVAPSGTTTPGIATRTHTAGQINGHDMWFYTSAAGLVYSRANTTVDAYDIITCGFQWGRRN